MTERTNQRELLCAKIAALDDGEIAELLEYVHIMESMRTQLDSPVLFEDELISILTDANHGTGVRRGLDWDRVRRRAERAGLLSPRTGFVV